MELPTSFPRRDGRRADVPKKRQHLQRARTAVAALPGGREDRVDGAAGGITDGMGLNITVMSYCGRVDVGICADRDQVPDVQDIADWMAEELDDLRKLAGDSS
ncbi:MAG TPA: WS/DGAT domain-containing protein [Actinokineospora sp.]|jgi:hypothetical protein|nr:WS/DGAT domain-containing protein [Actinokineospora sp.]